MTTELTVESLIAAATVPTEDVNVPGVGTVVVRGLTKAKETELRRQVDDDLDDDDRADALERLLFEHCVVEPAFTAEQVDALFASGTSRVVNTILQAIYRVNGSSQQEVDDATKRFRDA